MTRVCNVLTQGSTDWQSGFTALLPEIQQRLYQAFLRRDAETRDEAICDGTALCLVAYLRLHEQHRAHCITASNLAWYAVKQVRCDRSLGRPMKSKDVLSQRAQFRRGFRVEHLNECDEHNGNWVETFVQDRRTSVLDLVAARIDVTAWLSTLRKRTRQIACDLAHGFTTLEVARRHRVSASRISQMRRELSESWREFQNEPSVAC